MSINQRVMKRPLVIEEERINFDKEVSGEQGKGKEGKGKEDKGGAEA